ncbi:protein-tyrosine phosphatase-like protein [Dipodascopsis tothii]|uniref:protein-tyrosine phosphatase-like protein n=1 Tax=Dipodascopsis tothii TaxID=44089 RepID=UPI0034CED8D0
MAEFLRSAIASPRIRHYDPLAKTFLDLAYLEKNIIVCSMPTSVFPKLMYRNSLADLRKLLDLRHGDNWHVWEFRSEGAGYDDAELYNRVSHFPFPDHNPPPFALIPQITSSMHEFLSQSADHTAILHCKAGKGRSGTMFCSYLIAQHGWTAQEALAHFTSRRMKSGFGEGVSILSQRRWVKYVETWARDPAREYRDVTVAVREIRIHNPDNNLEITISGFKEHGRKIVPEYVFAEDDLVDQRLPRPATPARTPVVSPAATPRATPRTSPSVASTLSSSPRHKRQESPPPRDAAKDDIYGKNGSLRRQPSLDHDQHHWHHEHPNDAPDNTVFVYRPKADVVLTADINVTVEKHKYGPAGLSFLTATSFAWFNVFFETARGASAGTFSVLWEEMDGFKGTKKRGGKVFDRIEIDWVVSDQAAPLPDAQ